MISNIQPLPMLLGQAGTGEGVRRSYDTTWQWPPWVTIVVLMSLVLCVVWLYLRERGSSRIGLRLFMSVLRIAILVMTFGMLLGWNLLRERTDLPDLVLIIDDSESMDFADVFGDEKLMQQLAADVDGIGLSKATRLNLAKAWLLRDDQLLLTQLNQRYNLKVYRLGAMARRLADEQSFGDELRSLTADQESSRLGDGVRDVLEKQRGRPTAAIILVSDGVTTEGQSLAEVAKYARRKSIPLYLLGMGNDQTPRDLRLSDLSVTDEIFVDDVAHFDVKLTGFGLEGEQVRVRLTEQGKTDVLAETIATVGADGHTKSVRLTYRPTTTGSFIYRVEVETQTGESDAGNNFVSKEVHVRDETIRVLLAQAYPSFEYRFLTSLLGRQVTRSNVDVRRSIELTTVLQNADPGFRNEELRQRRVFPVRRDELFDFDVIIFGDVDPSGWSEQQMNNIADFVKVRGGGVVFIAGPRHTPLAFRDTPLESLFPMNLESVRLPPSDTLLDTGFVPVLTSLGLSSPHMQLGVSVAESNHIWPKLAPLYWLAEADELKSTARVLTEHPTKTMLDGRRLPVILMQFVGAGKVVMHMTDETYRWRAMQGDKYFGQYWIQTLRFLSRSQLLGKDRGAQLTAEREEFRRGESVNLRVRFFDDRQAPPQDDGVTVVIEDENGKRRDVQLRRTTTSRGVFQGTVSNLPKGRYRGWLAAPTLEGRPPTTRFTVIPPLGEQARLAMDSTELRTAAETSGGRFYSYGNSRKLIKDLPPGRQERIGTLPPLNLWEIWYVALAFATLFVLLLTAEWLLRKKAGML